MNPEQKQTTIEDIHPDPRSEIIPASKQETHDRQHPPPCHGSFRWSGSTRECETIPRDEGLELST
jgi:hypothetical protein